MLKDSASQKTCKEKLQSLVSYGNVISCTRSLLLVVNYKQNKMSKDCRPAVTSCDLQLEDFIMGWRHLDTFHQLNHQTKDGQQFDVLQQLRLHWWDSRGANVQHLTGSAPLDWLFVETFHQSEIINQSLLYYLDYWTCIKTLQHQMTLLFFSWLCTSAAS